MENLPWWLTQLVLPVVVAVVSGIGGSVLWEGVVRARRDRKALVAALRAEIAGNIHLAQYYTLERFPRDSIPATFRLQTVVFSAVANRLGDLDAGEIYRVAGIYRIFDELNRHAERFHQLQVLRAGIDGPASVLVLRDLQDECTEFFARLDTLLFQMADFWIGADVTKLDGLHVLPEIPTIPGLPDSNSAG